jgi:hypothetical protein
MIAAYKNLTGALAVLLDYGADVDMINKVVNYSRISWREWANITVLVHWTFSPLYIICIGWLDGTNASH